MLEQRIDNKFFKWRKSVKFCNKIEWFKTSRDKIFHLINELNWKTGSIEKTLVTK